MNKLVVILGPTSSGKSSLAIKLAQQFNGEIVSADSRQVYKNLNIGTGKVSKQEQRLVPHHLLDLASPKKQFTVAQYKKLANQAIKQIQKNNKLPLLVGGTAFYIYSVIDNIELPEAKPNAVLRRELNQLTTGQLVKKLQKLDPTRAQNIDVNNRHRLIRALEIIDATGKPIPLMQFSYPDHQDRVLILGVKKDLPELFKLIDKRLNQRVKAGLIAEVKKLLATGLSHRRLAELGLEYKFVSKFILGEINKTAMLTELKKANHALAKRQMTWFKRDPRIVWITSQSAATKHIKSFLK